MRKREGTAIKPVTPYRIVLSKLLPFSFKSSILFLYLPIIILFILITGTASYLLASEQIEENAYSSMKDTVTQTKSYLDNRLSDVFEQLVALVNHPDTLAVITKKPEEIAPDDYIRMDNHINRIYSFYNPLIDSILVHLHHGHFVLTKSESLTTSIDFSYEEYRKRFHGNRQDYYWRTLHHEEVFSNQQEKNDVISVLKMIGNPNAQTNGVIMFNLRRDFLENVLNNTLIGQNGYLILVNREGYVSFKQVKEEYQLNDVVVNHLQQLHQKNGSFQFQKPNGKKMIAIYDTLSVNQWKVAAIFPEEDILQRVNYIKFVTLAVIVVLIVFALFLANMLAQYLTKPITFLVNNLKTVTNDGFDLKLSIHAPSEISILYNGITDLMQQVNALLEQVHMEQEMKRQLELAVMQAQINPHFLYNTLYAIKGLCDMGMNKDASAMVTALSNFFRISISRGQEIITVQEEIEHISNYLFIQEMRYGDDFSYTIDVEPHILPNTIIKLTLQPLIENAIYHGVKQSRGAGLIQVKGYQRDHNLIFEIHDNGGGIHPEKLAKITESIQQKHYGGEAIGFGLKSVHERLQIHYGPAYGLTIASQPGVGTVAKVTIPQAKGR